MFICLFASPLVCMCVHACVHACVHVCVHACVRVCVCAGSTPTKQSLKGDRDNVSEKSELTLHTAVGVECF